MDATAVEVEAFFAAYKQAFAACDTAGICSRFAYPAAIADGRTTTILPDYAAFCSDVEGFFKTYREMGMVDVALRSLQVTVKSPAYAIADVSWALLDAKGGDVLVFDASYILGRHGGEELKIIAILSHNERERAEGRLG